MINFIRNGWKGTLSAAKAFWLGMVLPNFIFLILYIGGQSIRAPYILAVYMLIIFLVDYIIFVWQIRANWLCARNRTRKFTEYVIKTIVVIHASVVVVSAPFTLAEVGIIGMGLFHIH